MSRGRDRRGSQQQPGRDKRRRRERYERAEPAQRQHVRRRWINGQGTMAMLSRATSSGPTSRDRALHNGKQPVTDSQGYVLGGGVVIAARFGQPDRYRRQQVDDVGERNVISGSGNDGVEISGSGTNGNVVAGNYRHRPDRRPIWAITTGCFLRDRLAHWIVNTIGGTKPVRAILLPTTVGRGSSSVVGSTTPPSATRSPATAFSATRAGNCPWRRGCHLQPSSPQQGPNNLQNFPIIVTTADGGLQGWLGGSMPDTTFESMFLPAAYGPGGAGEAQDYLGSLNVTTDATGQVVFESRSPRRPACPSSRPRPLTLLATPPRCRPCDGSSRCPRRPFAPSRAASDRFPTASGNGIELLDPDAGPLDPEWNLRSRSRSER